MHWIFASLPFLLSLSSVASSHTDSSSLITKNSAKNTHKWNAIKPTPGKPITILIHGTCLPSFFMAIPGVSWQVCTPSGIVRASELSKFYHFSRLAAALYDTDPQEFPRENFYLFGWSGALSPQERKKAGQQVYRFICDIKDEKTYNKTPITVITVSHGGGVALNIAAAAELYQDDRTLIDRLVLLCSPIQDVTLHYAHSPLFKKIYHFYSSKDLIQVADPQGLFDTPTTIARVSDSFFSYRTFPSSFSHIIQTEIREDNRALFHVDFAMPRFIKKLPKVIAQTENVSSKGRRKNRAGFLYMDLNEIC